MKNLALILLLIGLSLAGYAQKNVLKVNPLPAFAATLNSAYERQLGAQTSLQLGFIYTGASYDDYTFRGYGITPEFHYFFPTQSGEQSGRPEGFYAAPYLRYYNLTLDKDGEQGFKGSVGLTGGGVLLGYQLLAGTQNNVALSFYGGPGFLSQGEVKIDRGEKDDFSVPSILSGFAPRFGLMVGYAF